MSREEEIAKLLSISIDEAKEVLECDKRIDKGEKLFEQTDAQKKVAKEMSATGAKKPTVYKFEQKKERKVDNEKLVLINALVETLETCGAQIVSTINEREINFTQNGKKYKIVLSAPRK